MVPGTYNTATGFYECGWGYTLDSQPDYVINVSEEFDLNGDIQWLRSHKASCERALDWMLKRDTDGNGLVEMMTDNHANGKSSDWIDVVWASWENALVNAAMYEALSQWSDRERLMADSNRAAQYRHAADKLRDAYRRPISQGGFWNDKEAGSPTGGTATEPSTAIIWWPPSTSAPSLTAWRTKARSGGFFPASKQRMRKENLFHWPLCFLPYAAGEGSSQGFPDYENGDIFLSWGELAVRSYSTYDPRIAVNYIRRVLDRYGKDGLSFQRYLRRDTAGAGDDILAGNCMTIVGLYRDIYGIRPQWNRLKIDPHLTPELDKTTIKYRLRGQQYVVKLGLTDSSATVGEFTIRAMNGFATDARDNQLFYYAGDDEKPSLTVKSIAGGPIAIDVASWPSGADGARWTVSRPDSSAAVEMIVAGLKPSATYQLQIDSRESVIRADSKGIATISGDITSIGTHYQLKEAANR